MSRAGVVGRAGRWVWARWEWIPTIAGLAIAGGIFYAVAIAGATDKPAPRSATPAPVVIVTPPAPAFAPIRIVRLDVEPDVLVLGEPGRLLNGICNDGREAQAISLYFGAQTVGADPLIARTVDLSGRDTPEGRTRVVVDPGCFRTEPIEAVVGSGLTPGTWRLVLKITAIGPAGQEQNVTSTSRAFEVRAGGSAP